VRFLSRLLLLLLPPWLLFFFFFFFFSVVCAWLGSRIKRREAFL
jgi:membrane protein implicated in regulation of membrane protease activity